MKGHLVHDLFHEEEGGSRSPTPNAAGTPLEEGADESRQLRRLSVTERALVEHQEETRELERDLEDKDQTPRIDVAQLLRNLGSDAERGLVDAEARARLATEGPNELEHEDELPLWKLFLSQFASLIVGLLLAACIASLALGEWVEGVAVIIIIFLNAAVATYSEHSASTALKALAQMAASGAMCVRDGKLVEVPSRELVPGDVVVLTTGDVVPADLRLLTASSCKVNEALLTGEADDVPKRVIDGGLSEEDAKKLTAPNMIFSSSTVSAGEARGVVVATGMNTRVGTVAQLLQRTREGEKAGGARAAAAAKRTPLQHKLHKLGLMISCGALTACVGVFIIGTLRGHRDPEHPENPAWLQTIMVAVSLAVSAIPEGLPLCVTICLALGTAQMAREHALVRKLPAVETLGSAEVVCTDKTGTVTEGKMTAVKLWAAGEELSISGAGFAPEGEIVDPSGKLVQANTDGSPDGDDGDDDDDDDASAHTAARATLLGGLMCSTAELQENEDGQWECHGNSSEAPLVVAAAKAGLWRGEMAQKLPTTANVPFNSKRKMMVTLHSLPAAGDKWRAMLGEVAGTGDGEGVAVLKGAPHYVIDRCTYQLAGNGQMQTLSAEARSAVLRAVDRFSGQALRVLAVAARVTRAATPDGLCVSGEDENALFDACCGDLVLLGLVASVDPPRVGVQQAVQTARRAGVRTVMITGDYLKTAVAIARSVDILDPSMDTAEQALDCSALRPAGDYVAEAEMDEMTSRVAVFARAKPEDKIEIVKSLRRQGKVTSMTGDGVNDAPALSEADIGVAMGIQGTEVAKGASDMILTDDNFTSIVSAIRKGRIIYGNIQRFVTYLLGTNLGQVLVILTSVVVGIPIPLQPLSILLLNLAIDGAPAMMMSLEPGDDSVMQRYPRPRTQPIIYGRMWGSIIAHSSAMALAVLGSYAIGLHLNLGGILLDDVLPAGVAVEDIQCSRYVDGAWEQSIGGDCARLGLQRARTMAFITIGISEVTRAFTVRQDAPMYSRPFRNKALVRAVLLSSAVLLLALLAPGVQSIFGTRNVPSSMWGIAAAFGLFPLAIDEALKSKFRSEDAQSIHWQQVSSGFESVLTELRNLRHHVASLESSLHVREYEPMPRMAHTSRSTERTPVTSHRQASAGGQIRPAVSTAADAADATGGDNTPLVRH